MANTLDLDPEWGGIELIEEVEAAFGIKLLDDETVELWTVGDLYELLCTHTAHWTEQDGSCASAVTFYRIRRALAPTEKRTFGPKTKLNLDGATPRRFFNELERGSGLRLPAVTYTAIGTAGLFALLLAVVGTFGALIETQWTLAAIGAGVTAVGVGLLKYDPCRVPRGIETIGDLVTRTVPLNLKQLGEGGARLPDRWSALLGLVQEHSQLPRDEIGPDTFLLRKGMQAATG